MPPQDKWAKPSREETLKGKKISITSCAGALTDLVILKNAGYSGYANLEEAKAQYLEMIRKVLPDLAVKVHRTQEKESWPREKEWRLKPTKVDGTASTGTNMVFVLPP
jgi:hypothetical protein